MLFCDKSKNFITEFFIDSSDNTLLVGVAHSDFDGDGCPDVLVLTKNETYQKAVSAYIYWNVAERLDVKYRK